MCIIPKHFLNTEQLVVFCDPVGTAGAAGLDEACVERNSQVSNRGIFCFAGTMAHDGGVGIPVRQVHGINGLGQ